MTVEAERQNRQIAELEDRGRRAEILIRQLQSTGGLPGPPGPAGPAGPAGPGVPAGGATGTHLAKTSGADYATAWVPGVSDPWHQVGQAGEPAFVNGWTTLGPHPVKFRKRADGTVELRGMLVPGTLNSQAFTLPVGYRHVGSNELYFSSFGYTGSAYSTGGIHVSGTGLVVPAFMNPAYVSAGWMSTDQVRFSAD
jgi:hypothetical protein